MGIGLRRPVPPAFRPPASATGCWLANPRLIIAGHRRRPRRGRHRRAASQALLLRRLQHHARSARSHRAAGVQGAGVGGLGANSRGRSLDYADRTAGCGGAHWGCRGPPRYLHR
ncbi:hypothetical protein ACU4GD_39230 [Cupriavidus basilensis]